MGMYRKHSQGFTLIEVMVTMLIAAIVLFIGIPSFQSYVSNNRQITSINDLVTAFNLARSTAITHRERVTVCKSDDGATCRTGDDSGDWSQGWMVFANPGNLNAPVDVDTDLIRVHGALVGSGVSFVGSGPTVNRVSFKPQGMVDGNIGTITYCDSRGASEASALVISFGGQVRLAKDDDGNGTVENGSEEDVLCPG
jgi:type IV fimbrial biogenesis protein FimT